MSSCTPVESEHIVTFPFRLSYYEAGLELPESERLAFFDAIFRYAFFGEKVELAGVGRVLMIAIKPNVACSRKFVVSGSRGGRPKKAVSDWVKNPLKNPLKNPPFENSERGLLTDKDMDKDMDMDSESEKPHTPAPPSSSYSLGEAIAADAAQAANAEPPVTRAEADARASQAGVAPDLVEKWWLFQQEQGWVNARGHRMSRDGAFASLLRWKISEHRFAQRDELTAKRIEAAEAVASRDGRNHASTSNIGRMDRVALAISSFRQTVSGIGKGAIYLEKCIKTESRGMSKADAEALRAGFLSVMGGHPGCVEEPEAEESEA